MRPVFHALLMLCGATVALAAPQRGENLLTNPSFERVVGDTAEAWSPAGAGYSLAPGRPPGSRAIYCRSSEWRQTLGAVQEMVFDPPVQHPFTVSGWSTARDAQGLDYCLYVDVWYADGTNLWGQRKDFRPGSHGWEYLEYAFDVAKPVTRVQYFVLFRNCLGEAWFDDLRLTLAPFKVMRARLQPGLYGGNSLDGQLHFSLPATWTASVLRSGQEVFSTSGEGVCASLAWGGTGADGKLLPGGHYTLRVEASDKLLGEKITYDRQFVTPSGPAKGFVAWTESSMTRILPTAVPRRVPDRLQARVSLARGEWESYQVVLRTAPNAELRDCRVSMSSLRDGRGHAIPARCLQWHQEGFVHYAELNPGAELPEDAAPGWWPDPLLPVRDFSVPPAFTQPLWFTVYAPPGTPPGTYRGQVTIEPANAEPVEVTVEARVYDFDVPVQPHMKTAFALMDGYLEKLYGKPLTTKLRRAYGDYVLQHRLNPDDISRTEPPDLDDLQYYDSRGLNAFNVLNMVEPRGEAIWVCWSPLEVYTPTFKQQLMARLDPYVAELKRRGLFGKAYIYTFDERGQEFWPVIREYFGMVRERYGIPTLTTAYIAQDPVLMKDLNVDWNCPLTAVYKYDQAEACRQAGLQVWAYTCCGPRKPFANILGDDPLIESRLLWWQAYHQKFDGFLFWGLNIWDRQNNNYLIDPERDGPKLRWSITTSPPGVDWTSALHGDGELLYPAKDGPLGCIRLANIRDGLEDYEYLWKLGELTGSVETARRACLPVTENLTTFTLDPQVLSQTREQIAARIERMTR
ncbi:MAG: DUF4091 domain-containing protein [Armatimonadetes bacterium]|nr:DUF4091 domain-containing protein [Armatimonadota bacterium]